MSLRRFLDCAYALLVEEYQRMGIDLLSALEKVAEWAEGTKEKPVLAAARQNDAAMAALTARLAGVQGAPR